MAHAATGRLIECRAALGASGIRWTKRLGRLDIDRMMRQQHVDTGLESTVHIGFGRIECAGHAGNLGGRVAHG